MSTVRRLVSAAAAAVLGASLLAAGAPAASAVVTSPTAPSTGTLDPLALRDGTTITTTAYPADFCAAVRKIDPADPCTETTTTVVTTPKYDQLNDTTKYRTLTQTRCNTGYPTCQAWSFRQQFTFGYGVSPHRVTSSYQHCYVVLDVLPYSVTITECSTRSLSSTTRIFQMRGKVMIGVKGVGGSYTFSPYVKAYSNGSTTYFQD